MKTLRLNNGLEIPAIGFGTYKASLEAIRTAIEEGGRYLDNASFYGNAKDVSEAISQTHTPRKELFIASKIWKSEMGYRETHEAFSRMLDELGTDYLDVLFIHWPRPDVVRQDWRKLDLDTWRAMEELYSSGKVRALGLSNFLPYHAENIIKNCTITPQVAQLEFHPGHTQTFALNYYREHNILLQAWSPVARGRVFDDVLIRELSGKYGITPAQVCISFCLHEGVMPLPRASTSERVRENFACLNVSFSDEDISRIENMPPSGWSGEHPDRERVKI